MVSFFYSTDKLRFAPAAAPFAVSKGGWVGVQVGLFSVGARAAGQGSWLDVDYFRVGAR